MDWLIIISSRASSYFGAGDQHVYEMLQSVGHRNLTMSVNFKWWDTYDRRQMDILTWLSASNPISSYHALIFSRFFENLTIALESSPFFFILFFFGGVGVTGSITIEVNWNWIELKILFRETTTHSKHINAKRGGESHPLS